MRRGIFTLTLLLVLVSGVFAAMQTNTASAPTNNTFTNDTTPDFTFNATSNTSATFSCELLVDSTGHGINASTQNNTVTTITANATLAEGTRSWYVSCTDAEDTLNTSTRQLTIDATAPTPVINDPSDGHKSNASSVDINFTITDNIASNISYTLVVDGTDNATGTVFNDTAKVETVAGLAQGNHTFAVRATDNASNSATGAAITVTVDTAAPNSTVTAPAEGLNSSSPSVDVNFTLRDAVYASIDYTVFLDGTANATGTAANDTLENVTITGLSDGAHTVTVQATDGHGRTANSSTYNFTVDTSAPSVTINSPVDGFNTTDSTPRINFTLVDNLTASIDYTIYVNGNSENTSAAANNTATTYDLSALADGNHTFTVQATDRAGNQRNSTTQTLTVDTTAPVTTVSAPANNSITASSSVQVNFTATDNHSAPDSYVVYVNGAVNDTGSANDAAVTSTTLTLGDGNHSVVVQTNDTLGNAGNSSTYWVQVDTTAPTPNLLAPADGANLSDLSVDFVFNATDALSTTLNYTLYIDAVANATGSMSNNTNTTEAVTVSSGTHNWTLQVTDAAGNSANATTQSFTASDLAAPANPVLTADDADSDGNAELSWTNVSDAASYTVYRSTSNFTNTSSATQIQSLSALAYNDTGLTNGTTYWYAVSATDAAGNENTSVSATSVTANDTIDPALPASVSASTNADGSVSVSWDAVSTDTSDNHETVDSYYVWRTTNLSSLNTTNTSEALTNTSSTSYDDTSITTGTNYTYVVTVADDAGLHNNATTSNEAVVAAECTTEYSAGEWGTCSGGEQERTLTRTCYGGGDTTDTETRSCSSSSGGGGGSSASTSSATETWISLSPGQAAVWEPKKSALALTRLSVMPTQKVSRPSVSARRVDSPSVSAPGRVFQYLDITSSIEEFADVELLFEVDADWLADNALVADDVVLLRLVGDDWVELETQAVSQGESVVTFRASTPGFSLFAIGERSSAGDEEASVVDSVDDSAPAAQDVDDAGQEASDESVKEEVEQEEQPQRSSLSWLWALLAVGVLAGLALWLSRRQ